MSLLLLNGSWGTTQATEAIPFGLNPLEVYILSYDPDVRATAVPTDPATFNGALGQIRLQVSGVWFQAQNSDT
ncbi:MAG: hypothetical protein HN742_08925 [Lentisphaerae bacterium]|nr:hypothetical protein [Lentisphaerota bacterium]MBT4815877.1 hypothetical protein [Lentisphaerota bacterium]MBT5611152.1 hypothetical protein [Lentisphaerota bacterium]MBT7054724.1 hypothetical protein [Lentisphaerota bacterium]MBT7841982.1 hypothetical protein [Lentisphaerota bacterium]